MDVVWPGLTILNLQDNRIESAVWWQSGALALPAVVTLNLSYNRITKMPAGIENNTTAATVNVGYNYICDDPDDPAIAWLYSVSPAWAASQKCLP